MKPNYAFAKRQKELAKKAKKEAKQLKKQQAGGEAAPPENPAPTDPVPKP